MVEPISFEEIESAGAKRILVEYFTQEHRDISPDNVTYCPLTGGRSGAGVTRFDLKGSSLVLRMFSPLDDKLARKREVAVTKQVGEHGIAPKVFYVDPSLEGMIIEYIPGHTIQKKDVETKEDLEHFGAFIQKLHSLPITEPKAPNIVECREKWFQRMIDNKGAAPSKFDAIHDTIKETEQALLALPQKDVLTHQDLIPLNILKNDGEFRLLDWPNSGVGDPFCDLATFPDFHNLDREQTRQFLAGYFGREPTDLEWAIYVCHRPMPLFWRAIGGFGFPDNPSSEFYEDTLKKGTLPSIQTVMYDFARCELDLTYWELALIFLDETERQINSTEFKEALALIKAET